MEEEKCNHKFIGKGGSIVECLFCGEVKDLSKEDWSFK